jgi:hypothetical protein
LKKALLALPGFPDRICDVELSPEERARIYEEEKAKREARQKLVAEANALATANAWAIAKKKQKDQTVLVVCVVAVVVVGMSLFYRAGSKTSQNSDSQTGDSGSPTMAYIMAEDFIRKQLKAPSTSEFPSQVWNKEDVSIVSLASGEFKVNGWADAQNAFGAKLRSNWACTLKKISPDTWQVTGFCGLLQ